MMMRALFVDWTRAVKRSKTELDEENW